MLATLKVIIFQPKINQWKAFFSTSSSDVIVINGVYKDIHMLLNIYRTPNPLYSFSAHLLLPINTVFYEFYVINYNGQLGQNMKKIIKLLTSFTKLTRLGQKKNVKEAFKQVN